MLRYLVRRMGQAVATLFVLATATFLLIHLAPGGPEVMMNPDLTSAERQEIAKALGLDQPVMVQYGQWLRSMLQGDFGVSFSDRSPVSRVIAARIPNTLALALPALVLAVIIAVPLGILSARFKNGFIDHVISTFSFAGVSIPVFWFGLMLILLFAVKLRWLPAAGMNTLGLDNNWLDRLRHMVLPVTVLSLAELATLVRYTRSSVVGVLSEDYIRTARAKGLHDVVVTFRHALRNALIPVVTMIGLRLPTLFGGAIVTESVFAWNGIGRLGMNASLARDYPVIMGITVIMGLVVVVASLLTDLCYVLIDPRVRYS